MCGIAGIISRSAINREQLIKLTNSMIHRGPDEDGIFIKDNVGIGHRRLSIIDLHTGKQPMSNGDATIWITYNGEIYNYIEIRDELIEEGYIFKSSSDTEVIIHAYEKWGRDCVKRFRGMFAFAIVDYRIKKVLLARDQLGIKPLVYYFDGNSFVFASEIQAFTSLDFFDDEVDISSIDDFLRLQFIPAPKTIYKKCKKLLPGHIIEVDFDLVMGKQEQYYSFSFENKNKLSRIETLEKLDDVLKDSVKKHLVSDVNYGAFLSGGIDSTLVVNYMTEILDQPVNTYSIAFYGDNNPDAPWAEKAAKILGTKHQTYTVKPDAVKIIPDIVRHFGEPFGDSVTLPYYYVSKLAAQDVKMALSGDGGDELFAGYNTYKAWDSLCNHQLGLKQAIKKKIGIVQKNGEEDWEQLITYINKKDRVKLWKADYSPRNFPHDELYDKFFAETEGFSCINKAQYMDINTYLPFDLLCNGDISGMMHGLEIRTPLTDRDVLGFATGIPEQYNYGYVDGFGYQGKMLLKELLEKKFSKEFVYRSKRGFSMPLSNWFKDANAYTKTVHDRLLDPDAKIYKYFRMQGVRGIVDKQEQGNIWLLLILEEWLQQRAIVM